MKSRTAKRRQEADARRGARRLRAQEGRASRTADLFAAADASPALTPALIAATPPLIALTSAPAAVPDPRQSAAPRFLQARGVPSTLQTAGHRSSKQLWYAAVFPELIEAELSAAVWQRLCLHAQQFTSFVSIEPPNAVLLEIKGSLKLLGPLQHLHANLDACWRRLGLPAHSATAPSTLAALWLARSGAPPHGHPIVIDDPRMLPGHLAELSIACTAWDIARLQTLRAMGVTRMSELLRLPRAGLARRLGAATVQDLDIALGRQFAPRRAFVPRERFRARCDFEEEIETVAYLEKALEPLIERCARFLRKRQAGVQALRLKLRHRAGPATCVFLGLASITSERRRLMEVLAQRLTRLELEAPVRGMELISGSLQPLSAASLDAFAGGLAGTGAGTDAGRGREPRMGECQRGGRKPKQTPARAPAGREPRMGECQLVERLRARLGEDAVYGIVTIPEHRPEAAWRRVHELNLTSAVRGNGEKAIEHGMPRPVWLLDAPLLLSEPDMQPCRRSGLILEQGPERIESGWWDGKGVARDYYIARQYEGRKPKLTPEGAPAGREPRMGERQCGGRLWVFQERQSKHWYLHGVFA